MLDALLDVERLVQKVCTKYITWYSMDCFNQISDDMNWCIRYLNCATVSLDVAELIDQHAHVVRESDSELFHIDVQ